MTKKDSFFTRLGTTLKNTSLYKFSTKGWRKPTEIVSEDMATPESDSALATQESENQLHMAEEETVASQETSPEQPETSPNELELEEDHPLLELWKIQAEQGLDLPKPCLCLKNKPGLPEALTEDQIGRELLRLSSVVSSASYKRLKSIQPKTEEDPPPDLDAQAILFLTSGQMSAWLLVLPPVGEGQDITLAMLENELERQKITYGLDLDLIGDIPDLPNRYFHLFLIAQGTPPERGKDGYIMEMFPRTIKHELTADEFDRVDYTSLSFIRNISKGETICKIFAPTPGIPGSNVVGRELTAVDGKKASVPMGRNTEISEDGSELIASMTGHVEFSGRGFQVKPVLEIAGNVDYSTGNINFLGDVHVHGDVCSGFSVRAIGSITIDGVVEACSIEAGGDLIMVKGALGNNQAIIRSHRNIYTKYLESTSVCARGDLQADCIVSCDIYCDGSIQVRSGQGIIKGGNINAGQEVSATTVGAISEIATNVTLGGKPCENFERGMLEQELAQLEIDLDKTERQPNSPTKLSTMSKLRMKIAVAKSKLTQLNKVEPQDTEKTENEQPKNRLVCGLAYPGTQITIKGVTMRLNYETYMCNARLLNGEISLM